MKGEIRLKRLLIAMLALLLTFPVGAQLTNASKLGFKDIPNDKRFWAETEISYLIQQGMISGYSDGTFRPNDPITRGQVAGMMVQALKLDLKNRPNPEFKDVSEKSYYYSAIAAVADEGIIRGSNGEFRPGDHVTRAQMAAILRRAFGYKLEFNQLFIDVEKTYWAFGDINSIATNGITWGKSGHVFEPGELTTRAQFSVFLARALNSKLSLYPLTQGINGAEPASTVQLGKWNFTLTSEALISKNVETNEEIEIVDEERVTFWMKIDLKNQLNKSLDDLKVDFDVHANIHNHYGGLTLPIILKSAAFQKPIRSYLTMEVDPKLLENPNADLKFHGYYSYPFESFGYSKFNLHRILSYRFLGNVRSAPNGDVKVGIYSREGQIHTAPKLITDILIKNDRIENGNSDRGLRDFRSFQSDGSRIFFYNSTGMYSMYYDGSNRKLLLEGDIHSFDIDGTKILVKLVSGKLVEVTYPK
jgi:hypothetical protein